jgi:hypothetical protein
MNVMKTFIQSYTAELAEAKIRAEEAKNCDQHVCEKIQLLADTGHPVGIAYLKVADKRSAWVMTLGKERLPVTHCPLCGIQLDSQIKTQVI